MGVTMGGLLLVLCALLAVEEVVGKNANKFIDLTHAFNKDAVYWPGRKPSFHVEIEGPHPSAGYWVASKGFCTSEHTATHIDAPYHAHREGVTLDKIPLEDLIDIPGVMVDIYDKVHRVVDGEVAVIENYVMTREDVLEWEAKNGEIPQRSVVLLRTGWDSRWPDSKLYRGTKTNGTAEEDDGGLAGDLNFPGFDGSAAQFLAAERNIRGVGIDALSVDPGNSKTFPVHRILAARGVWMLEMVANLHVLPPRGFNVWVVPFKIDLGTGAPSRVLARLNE